MHRTPQSIIPTPSFPGDVEPREPATAATPTGVATATLMLGPPQAVASQLVWVGQPLAAVLLTGFIVVVGLAWFWRVRPGRA